jgi:hypothetical protein
MLENIVSVYLTLMIFCSLFARWFSVIYLFIFFHWKIKTKHKMQYNFKLILKWMILLGGTPIPLVAIAASLLQLPQPLVYQQLIAGLEWPVISLYVFLITYALYKKGYAKKHELLLPLFYWSPAVPLLIYKRVQTELALGTDSGLCRETVNVSHQVQQP